MSIASSTPPHTRRRRHPTATRDGHSLVACGLAIRSLVSRLSIVKRRLRALLICCSGSLRVVSKVLPRCASGTAGGSPHRSSPITPYYLRSLTSVNLAQPFTRRHPTTQQSQTKEEGHSTHMSRADAGPTSGSAAAHSTHACTHARTRPCRRDTTRVRVIEYACVHVPHHH